MSKSPLPRAVFRATVLCTILILFLTLLTGDFILSLIVFWGICALVCGVMVFNIIWLFRVPIVATQYYSGDSEATQLLIDPAHQNVQLQLFARSSTRALRSDSIPVYCTPLEMLNSMSSESDQCGDQSAHVQTTVATVVDGFEGDFNFATCPFTSPPVFKIEIFVSTETVVHEDVVGSFAFGTPPNSPVIASHGLGDTIIDNLSELIEYCDDAIMESKAGDVDLI